jgi:hypothetical protein
MLQTKEPALRQRREKDLTYDRSSWVVALPRKLMRLLLLGEEGQGTHVHNSALWIHNKGQLNLSVD